MSITGRFGGIIRDNRFTPALVPPFERKLFYEGLRRRPYLERFGVLLLLATVIATVGVIGDSTATVIGAMIIAPLMTPIMATAAALVMGHMARAIQSSLLVIAGIIGVVTVSWLLGSLMGDQVFLTSNSQITSRISPRLIDLLAALAAGAAGAFAMSRDDIADSLPGVAIAISLVPPLCVVGVGLSQGEWDVATGALLLFMTNVLAILLAGGGVLAFLGLSQVATGQLQGHARRNAFIAIGIGALVVAIPLAATGARIAQDVQRQYYTRQSVDEWTAGTEFEARGVQVIGNTTSVVITGPGTPPSFDDLVARLQQILGPSITVDLEVIPTEKQVYTPPAVSDP